MAGNEKELHFTVVYRGKPLQLKALAGSTLGDLGKEIVDLTGVAPHTLRLILPKRPPLQPTSEQDAAKLLYQSGIVEGMRMVMMGSSSVEVAAVSQPLIKDRIIGFTDEEQRARQRSGHAAGSYALPKGNYIFCDFQTLRLPGIELNPPSAMALKIMHKLASDRGITAIMNKYRWRVGLMTEMAPIGYVGISPKCILGFNKNRGQEISLRLRTDDLKGFRKYESIKKTLLHELAHMVHDEHDEKFHALDKKLNDEAVALDWTKSQGHTISGMKFEDEEEGLEASSSGGSRGYKVGGGTSHFVDARAAAAAAALRRFGDAGNKPSLGESSQRTVIVATPRVHSEPDPDDVDSEFVANGVVGKNDAAADDISVRVLVRSGEPDPDDKSIERLERKEPDPDDKSSERLERQEPDPDHKSSERLDCKEPDPDEKPSERLEHKEPDPDDKSSERLERKEPDPDDKSSERLERREPDPDDKSIERLERKVPDPDEASYEQGTSKGSDPDAMNIVIDAPDRDETDDIEVDTSGAFAQLSRNEPDPDDEAVDITLDTPVRKQEPDPDEALGDVLCSTHGGKGELDTVHVHNKSTGDRNVGECVGCRRMAGKRMKSSTGGGFTDVVEPQMSR